MPDPISSPPNVHLDGQSYTVSEADSQKTKPTPPDLSDKFESTVPQRPKLILTPEQAAEKIQRAYKTFVNKIASRSQLVDRKSKAIIEQDMIAVNEIIDYSDSAIIVNAGAHTEWSKAANKDQQYRLGIIRRNQRLPDHFSQMIATVDDRAGNCGEAAKLLAIFLKQNSTLPPDLKSNIHVAFLQQPEDHAFVVIGEPQNEDECLVVDPWIKYLDLPAKEGFRPNSISAQDRKRGYIGSLKGYKMFLEQHADGHYVKKGEPHLLVRHDWWISEIQQKMIVAHAQQKLVERAETLSSELIQRAVSRLESAEIDPQTIQDTLLEAIQMRLTANASTKSPEEQTKEILVAEEYLSSIGLDPTIATLMASTQLNDKVSEEVHRMLNSTNDYEILLAFSTLKKHPSLIENEGLQKLLIEQLKNGNALVRQEAMSLLGSVIELTEGFKKALEKNLEPSNTETAKLTRSLMSYLQI